MIVIIISYNECTYHSSYMREGVDPNPREGILFNFSLLSHSASRLVVAFIIRWRGSCLHIRRLMNYKSSTLLVLSIEHESRYFENSVDTGKGVSTFHAPDYLHTACIHMVDNAVPLIFKAFISAFPFIIIDTSVSAWVLYAYVTNFHRQANDGWKTM